MDKRLRGPNAPDLSEGTRGKKVNKDIFGNSIGGETRAEPSQDQLDFAA